VHADLPALRRLFQMRDEQLRLLAEWRTERIVAGSRGQRALNPVVKELARLDAAILVLETTSD
jgi:hypothetical protein